MRAAIAIVLTLAAVCVAAQTPPSAEEQAVEAGEMLDELQRDIEATTRLWVAPLQTMARGLLFSLLGLALVWRFVQSVIERPEFGGLVMELVRLIMFAGFWLAVIQYSPDWANAITESFVEAAWYAGGASVVGVTPAGVLRQGISFVAQLLAQYSWYEWLFVALIGAVIVLMFAAIAAYMLLVYAELYIVTAGGVLLLGFGGSDWTADFARRYLVYTVSVGAKLFALLLVVSFSQGIFQTWATGGEKAVSIFAPLGVVFVTMILVTMLPNMIQGIINGSSIGSGGPALTGMMTGVSSAVAGGVMSAVKMSAGGAAAARATAAGVGATGVREGIQAMGGGAAGTARFAGRTAMTGARALTSHFGDRVGPQGSVVERLRGMQASAEAARDAPAPAKGSVAAAMEAVKAAGPGGKVGPGGE